MGITIGSPLSPALSAWLARPEGLFDLSSEASRPESRAPEPLFRDFAELPPLPSPKAPAVPKAPAAPGPAPKDATRDFVPDFMKGMREHHKWERGTKVFIECPYCGEETSTTHPTLTHYGKSCPRCGSKHWFDGRTKEATPAQRAFAQKTFGKPKPKGGWFPKDGSNRGGQRRAPAGRAPARSYR